jgi:hypothetical protein
MAAPTAWRTHTFDPQETAGVFGAMPASQRGLPLGGTNWRLFKGSLLSSRCKGSGLKIRVSTVRFLPWPPIPKARTRFGLFHVCSQRQSRRAFAGLPRERRIPHFRAFGPPWPLCSPFLSGDLASVREVTSFIDGGFRAVGCSCRLATSDDRSMKSHQISSSGGYDLTVSCSRQRTFKGLLDSETCRKGNSISSAGADLEPAIPIRQQ